MKGDFNICFYSECGNTFLKKVKESKVKKVSFQSKNNQVVLIYFI